VSFTPTGRRPQGRSRCEIPQERWRPHDERGAARGSDEARSASATAQSPKCALRQPSSLGGQATVQQGSRLTGQGPPRTDVVVSVIVCRPTLADLGLPIRTGLHTGELEMADGDVHGLTVYIAARISRAVAATATSRSHTSRRTSVILWNGFGRSPPGRRRCQGSQLGRQSHAAAGLDGGRRPRCSVPDLLRKTNGFDVALEELLGFRAPVRV
jgi:hypothetical protein